MTSTGIRALKDNLSQNKAGTGSILHRGKKEASLLCRILTFHFRTHDLQRTAATRVYDRYSYDAEKRQALDAWARSLKAFSPMTSLPLYL